MIIWWSFCGQLNVNACHLPWSLENDQVGHWVMTLFTYKITITCSLESKNKQRFVLLMRSWCDIINILNDIRCTGLYILILMHSTFRRSQFKCKNDHGSLFCNVQLYVSKVRTDQITCALHNCNLCFKCVAFKLSQAIFFKGES